MGCACGIINYVHEKNVWAWVTANSFIAVYDREYK